MLAGAGGELRLGTVEQLLNTQLHKQAGDFPECLQTETCPSSCLCFASAPDLAASDLGRSAGTYRFRDFPVNRLWIGCGRDLRQLTAQMMIGQVSRWRPSERSCATHCEAGES